MHTTTSALKPGRVTWVIRVRFCVGQTKIFGSEPDSASTALSEHFDLLAHAFKVQNCNPFSYHLAS